MSSLTQSTNKVTFYIDVSGSVGQFKNYWDKVNTVYLEHKENKRVGKIFIWDSGIQEITCVKLESMIREKKGYGGTDPSNIATSLIKNKINSDIIIFTDGNVYDREVQQTDKLLAEYQLDNVKCYIIGNNTINMSVTCPFTRNNNSQVYSQKNINSELLLTSYNKLDPLLFNTLDRISLDTFNEKYDLLEDAIISRNMGKSGDLQMKEKLLSLKKHLSQELANSNNSHDFGDLIRTELTNQNFKAALVIAKNMTNKYFESDIGSEIDKKINYLVSLCGDLRGKYSINSIKSNRINFASNVKVEESTTVEIDVTDLVSKPVECPIIMDTDVPQIMINKCEPILANLDKSIVDDITTCPLRILNYPEVVEKLRLVVAQWTGIKINDHLKLNPFTKSELLGTIPLGKCKQHIDCGNYTISKLFTAGKLLGNLNLYWAVIWYLIKQDKWEYLSDIKEQASEHLVYRLQSSNTFASLTGLSQYVITKVPSDIAVWYCVNSCLLDQPTNKDTCRMHAFNLDPMIEMLHELNYPIHPKTLQHIKRVKVLLSMLSLCKKSEINFRNKMTCLVQNGIKINHDKIHPDVRRLENFIEWIPTDGPASQEQINEILSSFPDIFSQLSINELVGISKLVNPNKSASDIKLSCNWVPITVEPVINWISYGLNPWTHAGVKICPSTFRPYYNIIYEKSVVSWETKVVKTVGPMNNIFSGCKKLIDFFYKYNKFPNLDMFLLFCYNRYEEKFEIGTLPYVIKDIILEIFDYYKPIFEIIKKEKLNADKIKRKFTESCSIRNRIKLEKEYLKDNNISLSSI